VVRIFDALNSESYEPWLGKGLPAAAGKRFVNRAEFVATKPHGIPPEGLSETSLGVAGIIGGQVFMRIGLLEFGPRKINVEPG
jgi:hypothetical protein